MKQYTFPLGISHFNEQRLLTGMDFQPVYHIRTPFFSQNQYLLNLNQEPVATIDHSALSQKSTVVFPDMTMGTVTDTLYFEKELILQRNMWTGEQVVVKDGQVLGRASYQNFRCMVEVHDEAYTEEVLLLSVINDYHYGMRVLASIIVLLITLNIIF